MKSKKNILILIGVLALISAILIGWSFFRSRQEPSPEIVPTPPESRFKTTPIITPAIITPVDEEKGDQPSELIDSLKDSFPLIEHVPYQTEKYLIDYGPTLTLKIKILQGTQTELEPEIKNWIKSKGVNPDTHQLKWIILEP